MDRISQRSSRGIFPQIVYCPVLKSDLDRDDRLNLNFSVRLHSRTCRRSTYGALDIYPIIGVVIRVP